jgi:hypothetical protein
MPGAIDKVGEQTEGAEAERHRSPVLQQPSFVEPQLESAEAVALG